MSYQYELEIQNILKNSYPDFLNNLGKHIHDKKFLDTIKYLSKHNKIAYKTTAVPVLQLIPTQSEIDINKSLLHTLRDPFLAELYIRTNRNIVAVEGKRIVTCGNGKYIIDGHHRWSQLLAINPYASILVLDFYELHDPFLAFKHIQLGIAADAGFIPTEIVKGQNLLTVSENFIRNYVLTNCNNSVLMIVQKYFSKITNKELFANFICRNLEILRSKNTPIPHAMKRHFLPQTSEKDGQIGNWINYFGKMK
jgi:hypothetical protein